MESGFIARASSARLETQKREMLYGTAYAGFPEQIRGGHTDENSAERTRPMPDEQARTGDSNLLVVEPDALTRWSLETYLRQWFTVHLADGLETARHLLDRYDFRAVVLSGDLPASELQEIETLARRRNPHVRLIRTVSGPLAGATPPADEVLLEKPFRLTQLADLLNADRHQGPRTKPPASHR